MPQTKMHFVEKKNTSNLTTNWERIIFFVILNEKYVEGDTSDWSERQSSRIFPPRQHEDENGDKNFPFNTNLNSDSYSRLEMLYNNSHFEQNRDSGALDLSSAGLQVRYQSME